MDQGARREHVALGGDRGADGGARRAQTQRSGRRAGENAGSAHHAASPARSRRPRGARASPAAFPSPLLGVRHHQASGPGPGYRHPTRERGRAADLLCFLFHKRHKEVECSGSLHRPQSKNVAEGLGPEKKRLLQASLSETHTRPQTQLGDLGPPRLLGKGQMATRPRSTGFFLRTKRLRAASALDPGVCWNVPVLGLQSQRLHLQEFVSRMLNTAVVKDEAHRLTSHKFKPSKNTICFSQGNKSLSRDFITLSHACALEVRRQLPVW